MKALTKYRLKSLLRPDRVVRYRLSVLKWKTINLYYRCLSTWFILRRIDEITEMLLEKQGGTVLVRMWDEDEKWFCYHDSLQNELFRRWGIPEIYD